MRRIMIIEDDPSTRQELAFLLSNEGYCPVPVLDFTDIIGQAAQSRPDLVLLDIGLPGTDGFSLCAELRKSGDVPIIFVTSRDSGMDEVRALGLGGDDYVTKPINVPVLFARIRSVLRRSGGRSESIRLEAAGLCLDPARGIVTAGTGTVELTRNELQILACLMERAGEIVSRNDLIENLWDSRIYIDDNTLSVNITRLRGKLAYLGLEGLIKTRRGMGYQI